MKYLFAGVLLLLATNVQAESLNSAQLSIKEKISQIFENRRMIDIGYCESHFRQFDAKGQPLMSNTSDVGVMQINQVHWKRAKSLGLDIFNSVEDNIYMAKIIYEEQGIGAWSCNKKV